MNCEGKEWFHGWFDSEYYHLLYSHRDESEAIDFLQKLVSFIRLEPGSSVIDLGCGKGRHSVSLNQLGYDVTGLDLSKESIAIAKTREKPGLRFEVQDMRHFRVSKPVDCIMNLFTSFGYFDHDEDNHAVLAGICAALVPGGYFVIDYLNAEQVKKCHGDQHVVKIKGIEFCLSKKIEDNRIIKKISVNDAGKTSEFEEKVQLFKREQLSEMLLSHKLNPIATFGDYKLNPFEAKNSDRLIIIARK